MTVRIPEWTAEGTLPPLDAASPTSRNRSPYPVTLYDLVVRFSTSPARVAILQGYLKHRSALHANGYRSGFQWLDGSFLEDVETLEARPPGDIDVVTFMQAPVAASPTAEDVEALDHGLAKRRFSVDSYFVELDAVPPGEIVLWSAYWYSLWGHRRNHAWKGFLQVDLRPDEDVSATRWLTENAAPGVQP